MDSQQTGCRPTGSLYTAAALEEATPWKKLLGRVLPARARAATMELVAARPPSRPQIRRRLARDAVLPLSLCRQTLAEPSRSLTWVCLRLITTNSGPKQAAYVSPILPPRHDHRINLPSRYCTGPWELFRLDVDNLVIPADLHGYVSLPVPSQRPSHVTRSTQHQAKVSGY